MQARPRPGVLLAALAAAAAVGAAVWIAGCSAPRPGSPESGREPVEAPAGAEDEAATAGPPPPPREFVRDYAEARTDAERAAVVCDFLSAALGPEREGEADLVCDPEVVLREAATCFGNLAAAAWDLEPDQVERLLVGLPDVRERLKRHALGEQASRLASTLGKLGEARGAQLLDGAKAAAARDDEVATLSRAERAFIYGAVPGPDILGGLLLHYRLTCQDGKRESAALAALRGDGMDADRGAPGTVASHLKGTHPDLAVELYVKAAKAARPERRRYARSRATEVVLSDLLGDLAPDEGFVWLLAEGEGEAGGCLEVARAFLRAGEELAAAGALEKAALVTSERAEAFRLLADVYLSMGDAEALKRTHRRAGALGIAVPPQRPDEGRGTREGARPGRVAWSLRRPRPHVYLDHVLAGGVLIEGVMKAGFPRDAACLWGIDAATGALLWKRAAGHSPAWLGRSGICEGYSHHAGLAPGAGRLVWDVALGRSIRGSGTGMDRARYLVDAASGDIIENPPPPRVAMPRRAVLDSSGRIAVGVDGEKLTAVDVLGGRRLWRIDLHPHSMTSYRRKVRFCLEGDVAGKVVAAGGSTGWVVLARLGDGQEIWRKRLPGEVSAEPLVAGGRVCSGTFEGGIWTLDRKTGGTLWEKTIPLWAVAFAASPDGGAVYVLSNDGDLYSLDAGSGRTIWERRLGGMSLTGALVLRGRTLYAFPGVGGDGPLYTSEDHFVHALDAATGDTLWAVPVEEPVAGRARPIVERERMLLAGSDRIICIRTDEGAAGLPARVRAAVQVARRLENAGRLREAAFAAAEAADRIDQGSMELMSEAARLAARAGLGPFAVRRIERWTAARIGREAALDPAQRRLLREELASEEKERAFRAAAVLARSGHWDDRVEKTIAGSFNRVMHRYWRLRNAALRAWAAHAGPGEVEAELDGFGDLLSVGLDHRRRGDRRCFFHLSPGKRRGPRGAGVRVRVGAPGGGAPAKPIPLQLPVVRRDLLARVVVPMGGELARDIYLHNMNTARPAGAATLVHAGVPGVEEALVEKFSSADKAVRGGAAAALARLGKKDLAPRFLEDLAKLPSGVLAELGAVDLVPKLVAIARTPGEPRRNAALRELVLLLGDEAGPVVAEIADIAEADPPAEENRNWTRAVLAAAYKARGAAAVPVFLRYGISGKLTLSSEWCAVLREHATRDDLLPRARELLAMAGRSSRNQRVPGLLAAVLGDSFADAARGALGDPAARPEVVLGAIETLGRLGGPGDVPAFARFARATADAEARRAATFALSNIAGPEAERALRGLHETKGGEAGDAQCGELAALALAMRGDLPAAMRSAHIHLKGSEIARRDAWRVFAHCFARETHRRGGGSYSPTYVERRRDAREALRWAFRFRELTSPEERLQPFSLFGVKLEAKPEEEATPERDTTPSPDAPYEAAPEDWEDVF